MDIKSILRIHTGFRYERLHFHVAKILFFVDKLEFLSKSYICNVFKDNSATSVPKLHKVKFRHYDLIIVSLSSDIAFFTHFIGFYREICPQSILMFIKASQII